MRSTAIPELDKVKPDTPLRLDVAAALAYPDGSMSASGLRREAGRGRLVIERTAGKDYTTLHNIERMRELCRVEVKVLDCGFAQLGEARTARSRAAQYGSFSTAASISPRDALKAKLTARSRS
jgi:hypothetical protein